MTYETVVTLTQTLSMVFFILLFLGVVAYALWPGNGSKFERAARLPLEPENNHEQNGAN